jgi:hypothetical protein
MSPLCLTALIEIDRLRNSRLELRFQGPARTLSLSSSAGPVVQGTAGRFRWRHFRRRGSEKGLALMNLVIWLPVMFVLGLAAMGICLAFVSACEVI